MKAIIFVESECMLAEDSDYIQCMKDNNNICTLNCPDSYKSAHIMRDCKVNTILDYEMNDCGVDILEEFELKTKGNTYYLIEYSLGEDSETCDGHIMYTYGILENVEIIREVDKNEVDKIKLN